MTPQMFTRGFVLCAFVWAGGFVAATRAEGPSAEPYEQDAGLLSSKITQARYRLQHRKDGDTQLSTMESTLGELRRKISELKDDASALASIDSKLRYLRTMELEPKERAIEQLKTQADSDLGSFASRARGLQSRIAQHNAQNRQFGEGQEAALAAYNAEAADLNQQKEALKAQADERQQYWQQQIEAAISAYAKVQKEFAETEEKHRKATEKFREHHDAYNTARTPLVESLTALDREPEEERNASVPLTPFKQAHPETNGEIVAAEPHPVGPGSARAIDQLRIVTASSVAGQETKVNVTSKTDLGYQFDTPEGLAPVDLPNVATPAGEVAEAPAEPPPDRSVPLVVPEPPPRAKDIPLVQAATQRQETNFNKLEQLYQQRRELMQQGPRANPQEWGKVVQDISLTQAKINFEAVTQKLTEGSEGVNLSVRRRKPIEVPSPTLPEKK